MGLALQKCIAFTAAYQARRFSPPACAHKRVRTAFHIADCCQGIGFVVAAALQTEKFYDLLGGTNFVLNAAIALRSNQEEPTTRQYVAAGSVAIWGLRLSSFLFKRRQRRVQPQPQHPDPLTLSPKDPPRRS